MERVLPNIWLSSFRFTLYSRPSFTSLCFCIPNCLSYMDRQLTNQKNMHTSQHTSLIDMIYLQASTDGCIVVGIGLPPINIISFSLSPSLYLPIYIQYLLNTLDPTTLNNVELTDQVELKQHLLRRSTHLSV